MTATETRKTCCAGIYTFSREHGNFRQFPELSPPSRRHPRDRLRVAREQKKKGGANRLRRHEKIPDARVSLFSHTLAASARRRTKRKKISSPPRLEEKRHSLTPSDLDGDPTAISLTHASFNFRYSTSRHTHAIASRRKERGSSPPPPLSPPLPRPLHTRGCSLFSACTHPRGAFPSSSSCSSSLHARRAMYGSLRRGQINYW